MGASPEGIAIASWFLPVRAGLAGPHAPRELDRLAQWLLVASGYQEREVRPLLDFNDGVAGYAVPLHCVVVQRVLRHGAGLLWQPRL